MSSEKCPTHRVKMRVGGCLRELYTWCPSCEAGDTPVVHSVMSLGQWTPPESWEGGYVIPLQYTPSPVRGRVVSQCPPGWTVLKCAAWVDELSLADGIDRDGVSWGDLTRTAGTNTKLFAVPEHTITAASPNERTVRPGSDFVFIEP